MQYVSKYVLCVFYVMQYDDFEDSDGVTSEGANLYTLFPVKKTPFLSVFFGTA